MWTRQGLKANAKVAFKANYWRAVLVGLLASLLTGGLSFLYGSENNLLPSDIASNGFSVEVNSPADLLAVGLFGALTFVVVIFAILLSILILNPLKVGCDNFFLLNRREPTTNIDTLERGFKPNFVNVVKVQFMTGLVIALWSLLFIIPGIYKALQYRLVPYILAENPDIGYKEAMQLSKELMNGHKLASFILDLSFLGWEILGGITFGILTVLYVNPYVQSTYAELYVALAHPEESSKVGLAVPNSETVEFEVTKN